MGNIFMKKSEDVFEGAKKFIENADKEAEEKLQ